ncbi:L-serine ammonia-lyase [Formicincola oecophyllae]|uniref:L-serine dehydratase n=1 Tax=Formicincola oecophyllae TaxID=2558361 RepID=A0A4Y6U7J4_9PROT|nr:L-serine ammonia-lyase [Formicincola oecophyllae]QDH13383.1 L-serine ammonia-lyase [Formicincola oecophyllae]
MISLFDLLKIGIGPSSSHTVGPMRAAQRFRNSVAELPCLPARIEVTLYGSLAWTAVGHGTTRAVVLGLAGLEPDTVTPEEVKFHEEEAFIHHRLPLNRASGAGAMLAFDPAQDIILDRDTVPPVHPNTLQFCAYDSAGQMLLKERYCSVGGGFITPETSAENASYDLPAMPYDFTSGSTLLARCRQTGLDIAGVVFANEASLRPAQDVIAQLDLIAQTMLAAIERGLTTTGTLPGALKLQRRAPALHEKLKARSGPHLEGAPSHGVMDWLNLYAMAVSEENASGGRIVTAPTNGAAGVIPAVLRYYRQFCPEWSEKGQRKFLLTAAAIGGLFKLNASISGAEVGCQGEVGVASSMAAAGLAAVLGATPEQVENAAEIAMEHHLGLTCDPVAGLVQIPCVERNAFGAVKAVNAASLAMLGNGAHHVSLDHVTKTMAETGRDMNDRYKETAQGGLAVNVPAC